MVDNKVRNDFILIKDWVQPGNRVLDLACGDGSLLKNLTEQKQVSGYGLEIGSDNIERCIAKGVNVIEHNLDEGLSRFRDKSFDTVIMTQAIQVMTYPDRVLDEMLRVGKRCIVTLPNFGHWRCRQHLLFKGRMPVSKFMPYSWYDTPNIHFCTFRDFEILCREKQLNVINRLVVDQQYRDNWRIKLMPNLMGEIAIYHLA